MSYKTFLMSYKTVPAIFLPLFLGRPWKLIAIQDSRDALYDARFFADTSLLGPTPPAIAGARPSQHTSILNH